MNINAPGNRTKSTKENYRNSLYKKYESACGDFKELFKNYRELSKNNMHLSLKDLTHEFKELYSKIYKIRLGEVEELLKINSERIFISTFELMEHDFRENSHSNILWYLFDHRFWNSGSLLLSNFLFQITNNLLLKTRILHADYKIYREYYTGDGRIDILIEDKINKFVIVIENKMLSNVAVKEQRERDSVSKTQLSNYVKFISKNYKEFEVFYILLSFYPQKEEHIGNFIQADYKLLLTVLEEIKTENNIALEYKLLLVSMIKHRFDKQWLLELSNGFEKKKYDLNTLELATNFLSYDSTN